MGRYESGPFSGAIGDARIARAEKLRRRRRRLR
jgi:hypothetical protein